jgi:hypothetical protein
MKITQKFFYERLSYRFNNYKHGDCEIFMLNWTILILLESVQVEIVHKNGPLSCVIINL